MLLLFKSTLILTFNAFMELKRLIKISFAVICQQIFFSIWFRRTWLLFMYWSAHTFFLFFQACAPLYQWSTYGFSEREPVGTCYLKKGNNIVEYSPCRSSMYMITVLNITLGCSCPYWVTSNSLPEMSWLRFMGYHTCVVYHLLHLDFKTCLS